MLIGASCGGTQAIFLGQEHQPIPLFKQDPRLQTTMVNWFKGNVSQ